VDFVALTAALENLVVERLDDGRFVRCSELPAWANVYASYELRARLPFAIDDVFPFLAAFLDDAAEAWREGGGVVSSDLWTKVDSCGEEVHLQAKALRVQGKNALVVARSDRLFEQHQLVLQRARELRLTHRAFMREIEQKDILMHMIVHDLAAPLHGILGALSLLNEQNLGEPSQQWIRVSLQAALRQRQLIGEILDVFSIENGPRPWDGGSAMPDVRKLITGVIAELTPAADRQGIRFQSNIDAIAECFVAAEETRLFRVLTNLVDNALRHSPRGKTVVLNLRREDGTIFVSVDDEGAGVPAEQVPSLFEKFARGVAGGAAGLGLYFCRITVERWGGRVGYEARDGGGARFWLRLPVASSGGNDG
jgi:signal transduction histidine kinase